MRITLSGILSIIAGLCTASFLSGEEYLYPVASFKEQDKQKVYLFYQKSLTHIELWLWDCETKEVAKALLSTYTPAGLRLLPNQQGFGFIDNGRIKVKLYNKRSPKSLDIYEPIYDINPVTWLDDDCCYFSAKERECYGIYHVNMLGELKRIITFPKIDCMYPQKVNGELFYIERTIMNNGYRYRIMQAPYPQVVFTSRVFSNENFDEQVNALLAEEGNKPANGLITQDQCKPMLDFEERPIAFLSMISEQEGFVIEHSIHIDKQDKTMLFLFHHIKKGKSDWECTYLFSFEIPLHLLLPESSSRLYESILPLLPKHYGNYIYYVDCSKSEQHMLNIFHYNLISGQHTQKTFGAEVHQNFFVPMAIGDKLFYGGTLLDDDEEFFQHELGMRINDENNIIFNLPFVAT